MSPPNGRRSKLLSIASRAVPSSFHSNSAQASDTTLQPLAVSPASERLYRTSSPASSLGANTSANHNHPQIVNYDEDLAPPIIPFGGNSYGADGSGLSSRRSSFSVTSQDGDKKGGSARPPSLSINYLPTKFTKLHAPGDYAHRRAKMGGGRDAFAKNAGRMGMMGTVDDDEGVVFQLGKGGLKQKRPKLRWNRFKWVLFVANTILIIYTLVALISAILVWLNVFYQSDVIRVGNRTELIISTVAAALGLLVSLIGFAGILLNNRAFLAVYTLLLWVVLALVVTPGYMTYKQRTFNLEGKINAQWSRKLGTDGRLRIQDALKCCGYFSPYVEATQSALCYSRSNFPGCKSRYLHLERHVLEIWYACAFALVPVQILIILAALLCSNHITYRFGKGLTPKRYRLDLSSMAVIMDEYAGQIAAQYGPSVAQAARNRSSIAVNLEGDDSRRDSFASTRGYQPNVTKASSRFAAPSMGTTASTGYNSVAVDGERSSRYMDSDADYGSDAGGSGSNHGWSR
ncbi:hypothetical protein P7C73_g4160, partial [Tremellales sp. Uapishka_1]